MKQRTLEGRGLAAGVAVGAAFVHHESAPSDPEWEEIQEDQIAQEWERLEAAICEARQAIERHVASMADGTHSSVAEVLLFPRALLEDSRLLRELQRELEEELVCAEHVVGRVLRRRRRRLQRMEDAVHRSRADDLADLERWLMKALVGQRRHALEHLPVGTVLVSRRLLPSDVVFLQRKSVAAVVLELGSTASHAALMARALGIPGVGQVADALGKIRTGHRLLVDGASGTVTVSPDQEAVQRVAEMASREMEHRALVHARCQKPAETGDGTRIAVMANIGTREGALLAGSNGADGIGLCRMERLYLARDAAPATDELREELAHIFEPVRDKPVTVRLLDAGGDKPVPYISSPVEADPFLGLRGVRVLLSQPEVLETQIEALLHLSTDHELRILVPMVTLAEEVARVRELLLARADALGVEPPSMGAMIETPAAALCASDVAQHCDFVSLGTNDLTQYVMVAGRENPSVSDYFLEHHPAVLRLLRIACEDVGDTPVEVCGELGSQVEVLGDLLGMGVRTLTVAPLRVPAVKDAVRAVVSTCGCQGGPGACPVLGDE